MDGIKTILSYRDLNITNGEYKINRFDKQKDIVDLSNKIKSNPEVWDNRYHMKNKKPVLTESRYFSVLIYPMFNEKHYLALNRIINSRQSYLGALHDKDVTGAIYHHGVKYGDLYNKWFYDGSGSIAKPKKIHVHLYINCPNKSTYTAVAHSLGIECNFVKPVDREFYRYLLHLDNTDKYQYADEIERVIFGSAEYIDMLKIAIDTPCISGVDAVIRVAEITEQYLFWCPVSDYLRDLKKQGFASWLSNPSNMRIALQLLEKQHKRIEKALKKDYDDYKTLWEAENDKDLHIQSLANKKKYNNYRSIK